MLPIGRLELKVLNLFMSDLDGTLLNSNQTLSDYTIGVVNRLIAAGHHFSIATARSIDSAEKIIAPLHLTLPIVLFNGVFIYDPVRRVNIVSNYLANDIAAHIVAKYAENHLSPIVYAVNAQGESKVYYKGITNGGEEDYIGRRVASGDQRFTRVSDFAMVAHEDIISINVIAAKAELDAMNDYFGKEMPALVCHYSEDIYSKYYWLELTNAKATKRTGIEIVKQIVGADRLVCFGDQLNDVSMFELADEKYAVANGHPILREMATSVIESNDNNGVAEFLDKLLDGKADTQG
ncbi:HAD family hydrolase [Paenibacillus sp. BC26]|uniref:HAD family hydrolase n=1 Tax=Paenibacillus sp. BC26 TaxID=1881032 RepID=UPI0008E7FED1|nr:HAD family hydrolase [Paenibacillus sp. BC26]SFS69101.1 hypothetical protein SAMN05428962_2310 [Paenibacillus sp. BC26]